MRQGVFVGTPRRPLLLDRVQRRGPAPRRPRGRPQARGRPKEARRGGCGGVRRGGACRPRRREGARDAQQAAACIARGPCRAGTVPSRKAVRARSLRGPDGGTQAAWPTLRPRPRIRDAPPTHPVACRLRGRGPAQCAGARTACCRRRAARAGRAIAKAVRTMCRVRQGVHGAQPRRCGRQAVHANAWAQAPGRRQPFYGAGGVRAHMCKGRGLGGNA